MNSFQDITAAILAGGFGTRLRKVVSDRPKVMAEVNGKPFLSYLFDQLSDFGIRKVVLCTGYFGEQIENYYGYRYGSLLLNYSLEKESLGTAGALKFAFPKLKSDAVLVMNGDSYFNANLEEFRIWHTNKAAGVTLLLKKASKKKRYGIVRIDDDGQIISFEEKGCFDRTEWMNAGIYIIDRKMIETIPSARKVSLEYEMFPQWVGSGLFGYISKAEFLDIGTPESFAKSGKFIKRVVG